MACQLLSHKRQAWLVRGVHQVPTLGLCTIASKFVEAGATPHIRGHAPIGSQQFTRRHGFTEDGARTQQVHTRQFLRTLCGLQQVHAFDDLLFGTRSEAGHGVVFIQQREVIKHVLLLFHHPLQTVLHDDRYFVRKGWVVADAIGDGARQNMAVTVFVLQTFAIQGGATRCAAQQETPRLHVTRCPGQVANALEAEHGVIHIERNHDAVVGRVGSCCRNPTAHATGFVDAFLQNLTGLVFLVVHDLVFVHRRVLLTVRVVNAHLTEQSFHAKGTCLVHQNRHHTWPQSLVAQQLREKTHIGLGGGNFTTLHRGLGDGFESLHRWHGEMLIGFGATVRQIATQGLTAFMQIAHLGGVVGRLVERQLGQLAVGDGDVEAVAEGFDVFVGQLLGLVNRVLALTRSTHAKTFDGLDQQHRGLAFVLHSGGISGIYLLGIMATTAQIPNVVVAHFGDHLQGTWVATKEMLAHISAIIGFEGLVVTVHGFHHDATQGTIFVAGNQGVPVAAPDQLQHIPARASKFTLQLLDDLAVATHRAIQALQIAVDDKNQVVELFTRGQTNGAQ